MEVPFWVAVVGAIGMVIAGTVTAVSSFKTALLNAKAQRDSANASADADKHKTDAEEIRIFRKELREEVSELRHELDTVRAELREAQNQIVKQNGMFVNIAYRLQGVMTLISIKDFAKLEAEIQGLLSGVTQFLDHMPIGGAEPFTHRTNLLEGREK